MTKEIIISKNIEIILNNYTTYEDEITGLLFYKPMQKNLVVETSLVTGLRADGISFPFPERIQIALSFLDEYKSKKYNYIEFHSSNKTQEDKYEISDIVSPIDEILIQTKIQQNEDYVYMIITPNDLLVFGASNPKLSIVDYESHFHKKIMIDAILKIKGNEINHDTNRFPFKKKDRKQSRFYNIFAKYNNNSKS